MKLNNYMDDGACAQAQAVLAFLRDYNVEASWSMEDKRYMAEPEVARWENCREQGYVVYLRNPHFDQLNIAFFEHRNSDSICAVEWKQTSINALTIDTARFVGVYKDKYDVSHSVAHGKCWEMAEWIKGKLEAHWVSPKPSTLNQLKG